MSVSGLSLPITGSNSGSSVSIPAMYGTGGRSALSSCHGNSSSSSQFASSSSETFRIIFAL